MRNVAPRAAPVILRRRSSGRIPIVARLAVTAGLVTLACTAVRMSDATDDTGPIEGAVTAATITDAAPVAIGADAPRLSVTPREVGVGEPMIIRGTGQRGCPTDRVDVIVVEASGGNGAAEVTVVAVGLPVNAGNGFSFTLRYVRTYSLYGRTDHDEIISACSGGEKSPSTEPLSSAPFVLDADADEGSPYRVSPTPKPPPPGQRIVISPATGPPGTEVTVWTDLTCGLSLGDREASVRWDGTVVGTAGAMGEPNESSPASAPLVPGEDTQATVFVVPTDGMPHGTRRVSVTCANDAGTRAAPGLGVDFVLPEPEIAVSAGPFAPGDRVEVRGSSFFGCAEPYGREGAVVVVRQGTAEIGRLPVSPAGDFAGAVDLSTSGAGETITGVCGEEHYDGAASTRVRLTVPGADPTESPAGPRQVGTGVEDRGRARAATALPGPDDVFAHPYVVYTAVGTTATALPAIWFGAELFNRTIEQHRYRIRRWMRPGAARPRSRPRAPRSQVVVYVVLSSLFAVACEPDARWNRPTLVLLAATPLAMACCLLAYSGTAEWRRRRDSSIRALPALVPGALGTAVVIGVLSRTAALSPAYVFGLVLAFVSTRQRHLTPRQEGRAVAWGAWTLMAVAAAAWVVRIPVRHALADGASRTFGRLLLENALSQTFTAAVVGLVFGLMPLRYCDGALLRSWSRTAWALTYTAAAFLFLLVLFDPSGAATGDIRRSIIAFVVFGVLSIGFWARLALRPDPRQRPTATSRPPDPHPRSPNLPGGPTP